MNRTLSLICTITLTFLFSIFLVHASPINITQIGTANLYIFGVSSQNGTITGVPARLTLIVTNGTGQVFLGSTPLTETDTQAQAELSTLVACQLINIDCNNYNFYYYITSSSAEVGGPSAGAAFSIAAMSVLTGKPLRPDVAMTGTANPDGSIGIVGDVAQKSMAAANQGIKIFLYPANEPAADNMSSQAFSYDENAGEVPIPISSVYQAYQYFTGYNITPALNYSIYTGLYNSLMRATYTQFNNYQQVLYNEVTAQRTANSTINNLISDATSAMTYQQQLVAEGNYYVAASSIVNTSATDLVYAKTLEQLNGQNNPFGMLSSLVNSENVSISQTYDNITSDYLTNSSTLDLKFIAIDRLMEASSFLNQAESSLSTNLEAAAYFYSLSEVKRASGVFWVSVLPMGKSNFSEATYYNLSNYYLYKASLFNNYAALLGSASQSETAQMQTDFNTAQNYQNAGHYVASIFNSVESIATAELIIEENSLATNSSVSQVTNQISTSALRLINNAEKGGATPFLGISYYQFGDSFINASLANYIQFESLSRTYTDFESALANASQLPFIPILQTITPTVTISYQDIAYLLLGFAVGVLISGFIYEYKLFRVMKRNHIRLGKATKSGRRKTRRR